MAGMRFRFFLVAVGLAVPPAALAFGCGTSVVEESASPGKDAGRAARTHAGGGGAGGGETTSPLDGGHDAFEDYVDPGCPEAGPKIQELDCDPYKQNSGDCPPGQGCYIFVQYPADPCSQEVYGAKCEPAGMGQQGDPCGQSLCAPGFACVVSGEGNQCVELCQLQGEAGCPPGLVCEPIDVEGFGGCL
jgi:hypothetical protein